MNKKYLLLAAALLVAACASDKAPDPKGEAQQETSAKPKKDVKPQAPICPQVAILREAQEYAYFDGGKKDPASLVAAARMEQVSGDCAYRKDGVDIAFSLTAHGLRGPRAAQDRARFSYFIAVVDPAERVLSRQTLDVSFDLPEDNADRVQEEKFHVFLPLDQKAQASGPDYRVLVGFAASDVKSPQPR